MLTRCGDYVDMNRDRILITSRTPHEQSTASGRGNSDSDKDDTVVAVLVEVSVVSGCCWPCCECFADYLDTRRGDKGVVAGGCGHGSCAPLAGFTLLRIITRTCLSIN